MATYEKSLARRPSSQSSCSIRTKMVIDFSWHLTCYQEYESKELMLSSWFAMDNENVPRERQRSHVCGEFRGSPALPTSHGDTRSRRSERSYAIRIRVKRSSQLSALTIRLINVTCAGLTGERSANPCSAASCGVMPFLLAIVGSAPWSSSMRAIADRA